MTLIYYQLPNVNAFIAPSRVIALIGLAFLSGVTNSMAGTRLENLLANSPFGQPKTNQTTVEVGTQPLEFRGVAEENGQQLFSILDTATKRTHWVALHATGGDYVVKNFDLATNTITVEQQGRPLTLTLKSGPKIAQNNPALIQPPSAQPGMATLPGLSMPQPNQNMAGKGPEAQRLQQIAEEIRKRRALRTQAPQMPAPGQTGQTGPVPNFTPGQSGPMPLPPIPTQTQQGGPMPNPNQVGPMPLPGATPTGGPVPIQQPH